jgi:putative hydrolase of the HAD superfamily
MEITPQAYQPLADKLKSRGITTIFFDIGEVILHVDTQHLVDEIAKRSPLEQQVIGERILADGNMVLSHIGQIEDEAYFQKMVEYLEFDGGWEEMMQLWESMLKKLHRREEEMEALKALMPCGIISNIPPYHVKEVEGNFNFVPGCEWVIYSCDVGYVKPREEIFHAALEKSGKEASECLLLDDRADNIAKAKEMGFHTVQVFPEDYLKDCIERL